MKEEKLKDEVEQEIDQQKLDDTMKQLYPKHFIENICRNYHVKYDSLPEEEKLKLFFECREWIRSILKEVWKYT